MRTRLTHPLPRRLADDLQAALIRFQQQQPQFEENVSRSIQSAAKLYEEAHQTEVKEVQALHEKIAAALQRVEPDAEWKFYLSRSDNTLIDPETPFRSIDAIQFPGQNHASTAPLKEGYLERKKRFSKKYTESYYVLTPSGYLHERRSSYVSPLSFRCFSHSFALALASPPYPAPRYFFAWLN